MRKLIILFAGVLLLSCGINKEMIMSDDEMSQFATKGDTIYYNGKSVAYLESTEWEYIPERNGKPRLEISVTQFMFSDSLASIDIIRYLHTRYRKAKIEINHKQ